MEAALNHLWQSTVFAGLAWLLTLALKKNRPQTRYWVWFAASLKFLVPLALLVAAGSRVSWRTQVEPPSAPTVVEEIAQPFGASAPLVAGREPAPARTDWIPELLLLIWAAGFVAIGIKWGRRWTRMSADARKARAIEMGLPVPVRSSAMLREPGVFGIFRPVLLLPEGITDRLTGAQLDAILAHEMCHVRRRDNLMTSMHMVVEAVFWFHPLVWWIGARLMEERERACDEEVLRAGNDAQTYAEGILKVCEFYLRPPLECVSGVAGGNLNRRIEEIMTNRIARGLSAGKKMVLACAGMLAVAGPVAIGIVDAPPIRAQGQTNEAVTFEVASVKPVIPTGTPVFRPSANSILISGNRVNVRATTLVQLVELAYGMQDYQVSGGPNWAARDGDKWDIAAKAEGDGAVSMEEAGALLQNLLAERFHLKLRHGMKELPVYNLVVAKGGPKMEPAPVSGPLNSQVQRVTMEAIVRFASNGLDRPLIDKTGLTGMYLVSWRAVSAQIAAAAPGETGAALSGVEEALGLKAEPAKAMVEMLVIESAEKPTEN